MYGTPNTSSGILINSLPQGGITGNTICEGAPAYLSFGTSQGNQPFSIQVTDGGNTIKIDSVSVNGGFSVRLRITTRRIRSIHHRQIGLYTFIQFHIATASINILPSLKFRLQLWPAICKTGTPFHSQSTPNQKFVTAWDCFDETVFQFLQMAASCKRNFRRWEYINRSSADVKLVNVYNPILSVMDRSVYVLLLFVAGTLNPPLTETLSFFRVTASVTWIEKGWFPWQFQTIIGGAPSQIVLPVMPPCGNEFIRCRTMCLE